MKDNPESFQDALHKALNKSKERTRTPLGKMPPQAIDLEQAVIGAVLIEKYAFDEVSVIINANSFYKEEHQEIFTACQELKDKNKPIDILTVMEHLRLKGKLDFIGGAYALTEITNRVGSSINIAHHAYIIKEKEILRNCISLSSDINTKSYDATTDAFELLDDIENQIGQLQDVGTIKEPSTLKEIKKKALKNYEKESKGSGVIIGADNFDNRFRGFEGGDLIILAARPSMGKTAFCLELAKQTSCTGISGAIFSLEMSEVQLIDRLTANYEEIPLSGIKNKNLTDEDFEKYVSSDVGLLPIYIDDTPNISIGQIKSKAQKLKKKYDIGYIIVDYLQLIKPPDRYKGNKTQEIGYISRQMKILAKELDVPIICLSQLSRAVESRGGLKKPQMSDLRESGDIEQDADVILFLWRPEYYEFEQDEDGRFYEDGETHILCSKYRNGELGNSAMKFNGNFQTFKRLNNI